MKMAQIGRKKIILFVTVSLESINCIIYFQIVSCHRVCKWGRSYVSYATAKETSGRTCKVFNNGYSGFLVWCFFNVV